MRWVPQGVSIKDSYAGITRIRYEGLRQSPISADYQHPLAYSFV